MSHDHNYKVQEDLTISTWGNSCLLLGNIARILQINQSCFALCIVISSSHRSVIFVLFFLYFGSTGIPSNIKLCLTAGSTTWSDFSSRTTITSAENPNFEIWLELNSPYKFSTAYSANNRADSLHRKLLSYRQNRNDAKIYSGARSSCYFNTRTEIQGWQTPVCILLKFICKISLHAGRRLGC